MTRTIEEWDSLADRKSGRIATVAPIGGLPKPTSVEVNGDEFLFQREWRTAKSIRPRRSLLEEFASARSDEALLTLARSAGPLVIGADYLLGTPLREPIKVWRQLSDEFRYLLSLAASLAMGDDIKEDPATVYATWGKEVQHAAGTLGGVAGLGLSPWRRRTEARRRQLAVEFVTRQVNRYMALADIRPLLVARGERFFIEFGERGHQGMSLAGALTVQLMTAATGKGFAVCSSCRDLFAPTRKPAEGRRSYCPRCGRKAALRDAKAAQRARERGEVDSQDRSKV